MEISVSRNKQGDNLIELGPVVLNLNDEVVHSLSQVVSRRLSQSGQAEAEAVRKKVQAYRVLATKMQTVDDRVLQRLAVKLSPEQLVTLVRLADGRQLYQKLVRNLSKTNRHQFEDDYQALDKITFHQAIVHMEQVVPLIKLAASEQKALLNEKMGR